MAETLEFGIGDLSAEFLAHTLVFGPRAKLAGTVSALLLEPLLYARYELLVLVESYLCHKPSSVDRDNLVALRLNC